MADHASANLLLGERTVPGRFVVYRLATDEVEREEQERQFAESYEVILQEIAREAKARDFRLRGDLAVRLHVVVEATGRGGEATPGGRGLAEAEGASEAAAAGEEPGRENASVPVPPSPPRPLALSPDLWARLQAEREVILPEKLRTLLVESRPSGAAVYLDNRQVERVTPCRVAEVPAGEHALLLALPGFLPQETIVEVPELGDGEIRVTVDLEAEPPMGVLEVITFPSQATVTVADAPGAAAPVSRATPCRLRLPAGCVRVHIDHTDYEPREVEDELPAGNEGAPGRLQVRLQYAGDDRDQTVGRLIIYKPESSAPPPSDLRPLDRPEETIATFFRDQGVDLDDASRVTMGGGAADAEPEVLGERPITKGVLLIGRADRHALVTPDVKLFDAANTVTRGCHAWLHVYTDPGTGAEFNTFVIHNNSPSGTLVNGRLVMESAAIGDEAELRIGIFRMRVVKETPSPRVEF
jgi:hypothetical protein